MAIKNKKNRKFKFSPFNKRGFVFIEIIISVAIVSIAFGALLSVGSSVFNLSRLIWQTTTARSIAIEEMEAVRVWRDSTSWSVDGLGAINTGSSNPYHFLINTGPDPDEWNINSGSETVDGFTKTIVFDKVSRDLVSGNIQSSYNPANDDPDTRKVTVTVSWSTQTLKIATYFTNWK